jgi:hypothetical protein
MVVIEFSDGSKCYCDGWLSRQLEKGKKNLRKDDDLVLGIVGGERNGKSTFAQQMAKIIDPTFNHTRMSMTATEFNNNIDEGKPYTAIVFDEGYRGFNSRKSMSEINNILNSKMMEVGQKNLIIFIVLPSYFMLDRYIALHRLRGLFVVYRNKKQRGFWMFFNKKQMPLLYDKGKKTMSYSGYGIPRARHRGRFYDQWVIDEKAYREKKKKSLTEAEEKTTNTEKKFFHQRNMLLSYLRKKQNYNFRELAELCASAGFKIDEDTLSQQFNKYQY